MWLLFMLQEANNREDKEGQYVEQVWKAVNFYAELLKVENVILIGDLYSNKIWAKPRRFLYFFQSQQVFQSQNGSIDFLCGCEFAKRKTHIGSFSVNI